MQKLLGVLILAFSTLAHAGDFSGHWIGSGTITRKDLLTGTVTEPCPSIEITIEHLPERMTIQRYNAQCGTISPDWGPRVFDIQETKVFDDEVEVGTLENDLLKTLMPSGGVAKAFNLRLSPPAEGDTTPPLLESYYGVQNLLGTIVIEGNLNPAPPPESE